MAIRTMTSADKAGNDNVEVVTNYPGHEVTTIIHNGCPFAFSKKKSGSFVTERSGSVRSDCTCDCKPYDPLYMETTYVGCVLSVREMNGYDDSDFYATVWDEETESVKEIMYASTRSWTYPNGAKVDATPDVRHKAAEADYADRLPRMMKHNVEAAKNRFDSGTTVKVVRGRKIPKGVVGTIFWINNGQWGVRIGITVENSEEFPEAEFESSKDGDSKVAFLALKNVESLDWEKHVVPIEDVERRLRASAASRFGVKQTLENV
jgi:hypothetical protein